MLICSIALTNSSILFVVVPMAKVVPASGNVVVVGIVGAKGAAKVEGTAMETIGEKGRTRRQTWGRKSIDRFFEK